MLLRFLRPALLSLGLMLAFPPAAFAVPPDQIDGWRADLAFLTKSIREIHPAPFNAVSQADFEAAVARLNADLPNLDRDRVILEFARIVALIGDGHTNLELFRLMHAAAGVAPFQPSPIR